jgi:hypothetical protein
VVNGCELICEETPVELAEGPEGGAEGEGEGGGQARALAAALAQVEEAHDQLAAALGEA